MGERRDAFNRHIAAPMYNAERFLQGALLTALFLFGTVAPAPAQVQVDPGQTFTARLLEVTDGDT
jgi:hypothetical protein